MRKFWKSKWFSKVVLEVLTCIGLIIIASYLRDSFIKDASIETLTGAVTMLQSFNSGLDTASGRLIAACLGAFAIPALLISVVIVGWISRVFAWIKYRDVEQASMREKTNC